MNNQSKDQKNFNRQQQGGDRVQSGQNRSDFQQNQKSTGGQRNISPDSRRSPTDTDLNE